MMAGPRYSIMPADAVFDLKAARLDIHVLAAIGTHTDNNGWCILRQKTLAEKIGSTAPSVRNSIGRLVKLGYLRVRHRHAESGAQLASYYQVVMDREPVFPADFDDGITIEAGADIPAGRSHPSAGEGHSQVRP
ncbi:helix-turn-helix domain-containing protein [Mesorhizobium sp. M5C.F.Ca.IN.020.32.2.1]|nr:helix-turn-helix domain-containing protein [Mesorhizobium sp. M5C.F.Ca.IN.020.32.2.1]